MPSEKAPGGSRIQIIANALTILVAVAAIGLSVWEGRENRLHNRLSVMPHLERIESTVREGFEDSTFTITYSLYNSGLGPAVLDDIVVYNSDTLLFRSQPGEKYYDFSGFMDDVDRIGMGDFVFTHSRRAGELLRAGEEHLFFRVSVPVTMKDSELSGSRYLRQEVLSKYSFVFCYCSVYGENCNRVHLGNDPPEGSSCRF